jgi:hypothetical protein
VVIVPLAESTPPGYAAVLIDVVRSRSHPDRGALEHDIAVALAAVNGRVHCLDPLTATVGDEVQGIYPTLRDAVRAVVEVRLELVGNVDLRAGIGWGDIVVYDPDRAPFGQDGPAWWSARAALDRVAASTPRRGYAAHMGVDIAVPADQPTERGGLPDPLPIDVQPLVVVVGLLALFDRAIASLDRVEARIVLGDLHGATTDALAEEIGLTPSAISQRRTRNRLREVVAAVRALDTAA